MNLALIPARAGSKGLPGKNILPIAGKSLIGWTIDEALRVKGLRVVVSTDDKEIARLCRNKCEVLERPAHLATDEADTIDVVMHAIEATSCAYVILLQPTSPLRLACDIKACIDLAIETGRPCVSVTEVRESPWLMYTFDGELKPVSEHHGKRRQDCPIAYRLNGAIYVCTAEHLRRERSFIKGAVPYVMPIYRSADIDTLADFKEAERQLHAWFCG